MQRLERPDDALHVGEVEGLVAAVEVDPAGLAGDVGLPLVHVLQHRGARVLVEHVDAHRLDLGLLGDAELLHRLELGGQPVGVPAEHARHLLAAHGVEAREDVLGVAGEQVAVVRQAVGERRAVVEDPLGAALPLLDRRLERVVALPEGEDAGLERREVRAGDDGLVARERVPGRVGRRLVGHAGSPASSELRMRGRSRAVPPRLRASRLAASCPRLLRAIGCDGPAPFGSTEPPRTSRCLTAVLPTAPR